MAETEPNARQSPLTLTLFGPFEVRVALDLIPPLRTRKGYRLLALLALRAPREVERTWLAGMLWPDSPEPQAFANLRNTLKDLRHALGDEAKRLCSPSPRTLLLDLEETAIDVAVFDRAIARGDPASLEQAVTLYRGPLLEGWSEEWAFEERQVREQACLTALERLAEQALAENDLATAERHLRRVVALDPLRESTQRALMQTLAAGGSYAAAALVYRELRMRLHREIHTEPDPETQRLYQQLRAEARRRATRPLAGRASPTGLRLSGDGLPAVVDDLSPAEPEPVELPTGTVTFLFTDIEGSTRLLHHLGNEYSAVLVEHHRLLRAAIQQWGGVEIDTAGDGFFVAFPRAIQAVMATLAAQQALLAHAWPQGAAVRVRMGLHTGEPAVASTGYVGMDVHRAARIAAAGHGGQVVLSQTTHDLVLGDLPEGVNLLDLGSHALKDLQRPEQLYQLVHPDLPAAFPPLKSLASLPNNLPIQLTTFIGREREMADVEETLKTTRLLTLTGPGGCGKTRLALQVASELVEEYTDGVWLVELAALTEPGLVPQKVADALGVREEPRRQLIETLKDHLEPRRLLLLLDNCEHLVAACAALAHGLLRACPQVQILATSRESLGVEGEADWRVPSLSLPDRHPLPPPDELTHYEAVRLFVERAALVQPAFAVTADSAPSVAQVCRRLDGIPLAIELAAARVKAMPVEKIAERLRLHDGFRLLQPLLATIDWSYNLLSDAERTMLARVSVFAGYWTLEAAEGICSGDGLEEWEVLDLLTRLVDKSLVLYEAQEGEGRYWLLEAIRQYGEEKLQGAGEWLMLRRHHRDWFLNLAEQAQPELFGPEQARWLERLERHHDDLRAALAWAAAAGEAEIGLRLGAALWRFWYVRGHLREGQARLEAALALSCGSSASSARARALNAAGSLAHELGDLDRAAGRHAESLAIGRALAERGIIAYALLGLGNVAMDRGEYQEARRLYEQSLALWRELGSSHFEATLLDSLGQAALGLNQPEEATRLMEESLTLKRRLGNPYQIAVSLNNLGYLAIDRSQLSRAALLLLESLELFERLGDHNGIAESLNNLARLAVAQGDLLRAACLLAKVRSLSSTIDVPVPVDYEQILVAAHTGLDEEAFESAWSRGQIMTLDEVVAF